MTHLRQLAAASAALLLLIPFTEALPAQDGSAIGPNLRDRTLAPSQPFDFGRRTPQQPDPRRWSDAAPLTLPAARGTAVRLAATLAAPGSVVQELEALAAASDLVNALEGIPDTPTAFSQAVDAYNRLVMTGPESLFVDPAGGLEILRAALLEMGAVAAKDPGAWRSSTSGALSVGAPTANVSLDAGDGVEESSTHRAEAAGYEEARRLRAEHLIGLPETFQVPAESRWEVPGITASNPHAFGAQFGEFWASASAQPRVRRQDDPGAAMGVGFGLGDAHRYVGFQAAVMSFTSRSGFGDRGAVDLQLHRTFEEVLSLAIGWESAYHWGGEFTERDSGSNIYGVASYWHTLAADDEPFSAVVVSVGLGDGRFQPERSFVEGQDKVGFFGSIGIRVWPPGSLILEWTGQDLLVATSIAPLRERRLAVVSGITDITGNAGDGVRFFIGASAAYDFVWR